MLRNVVHLIPVAGAIAIVYLNIAGMYLGDTFNSIAALQFAAKFHEIFMVASLSQLVLHLVRNELTSGDGLPFGALVSGLQFSQLSYLWSLEFWGLATSPSFLWWRKMRFMILIVVCVTLAASVGPSSAIAMIPRSSDWPAGVTNIWLNGTMDQIFPPENLHRWNIPKLYQFLECYRRNNMSFNWMAEYCWTHSLCTREHWTRNVKLGKCQQVIR